MSSSNETSSADLRWVLAILIGIGLVIVGFYYVNFQYLPERNEVWWPFFQYLSEKNDDWGTFGDYVGGILNPVIAAFAFYLIRETYKLQIKASDAQNDQVKLAALTALLNSNLTRIGLLKSERIELLNEIQVNCRPQLTDTRSSEDLTSQDQGLETVLSREDYPKVLRFREINCEIKSLIDKNNELEEQIEAFLKKKTE